MRPLALGVRHTVTHQVTPQDSVRHILPHVPEFTSKPEVMATGLLVAVCEWPAMRVLDQHLEPGECALGTGVHLTHRAPVAPGALLTVTARAILIDELYSCWQVSAADEHEVVARGTVDFTVVELASFLTRRLAPKLADPPPTRHSSYARAHT